MSTAEIKTAHTSTIAAELGIKPAQVAATIEMLDDGGTVPFIARYRKERTGALDEVAITAIRDRALQLRELDKRRGSILESLSERDLLTDELAAQINAAESMAVLEDLYLPYRPKRRTRAMIARERGLEPLAELILAQEDHDPVIEAGRFVDAEKEVPTAEEALAGARDIIAEWINEDARLRSVLRDLYQHEAVISARLIPKMESEGAKFADYFDWQEPLRAVPSHRMLAMLRGENEGVLRLTIAPETEAAIALIENAYLDSDNACSSQVALAVADAYKRLLAPAMETEMRAERKVAADSDAIDVFRSNLGELLMAPPLGSKAVLAVDPGLRTGCKLACLDRQGMLLEHATIYPHSGESQRDEAAKRLRALCLRHKIEVIAIGNGTAGRETEQFVRSLDLPDGVAVEMVDESGASIYSASEIARNEFPDHDITVRGAVSIGRRLQDPLAELVKIEPKSIGVGQYQHDVDQHSLKQGLDDTVISCVNRVGVEINSASPQLLSYVAGLGPQLAKNIMHYRAANGPFSSRDELKAVPRLGPKAFEQAAGFLRISDSKNPLDRSAVHPESYHIVEKMAKSCQATVADLMSDEDTRRQIRLHDYLSETVGMPTLVDIMDELAKPGRDPRAPFEQFAFDDSVMAIEDVQPGMTLPGIVTNVTAFGAFVDIGVHQDGLVHISELADEFVRDPSEFVKVRDKVRVTVLAVDTERRRISLSMRSKPTN